MGRHGSTAAQPKQTPVHKAWRLLPKGLRARVWMWRKRWRAFWDRRHTPKGEWDAQLPKDAANWTDELNWGSVGVAVTLRTTFRRRGDLLPDHSHDQEKS